MVRWVVGSILHGRPIELFFSTKRYKGRGMCYPVCEMLHIKEPLLLIGKSSLYGGSEFPLSLSEWSFTIAKFNGVDVCSFRPLANTICTRQYPSFVVNNQLDWNDYIYIYIKLVYGTQITSLKNKTRSNLLQDSNYEQNEHICHNLY